MKTGSENRPRPRDGACALIRIWPSFGRIVCTSGAQRRGRVRHREGATIYNVGVVGKIGTGLSATLRCHTGRGTGK